MDPFLTYCFGALDFKHSQLNWKLKNMTMTEYLQNCRFYRIINSKHSSEIRQTFNLKISK